jgi:uncharacterized membrane protein
MENKHHRNNESTLGQKYSDKISELVGSWKFIGIQTVILSVWIILNITAWVERWDPYPFIFLNLIVGIQATYTAPIIMMSQNRAEERDRKKAEMDYQTNRKSGREIEQIQAQLTKIDTDKLDKIIRILENK